MWIPRELNAAQVDAASSRPAVVLKLNSLSAKEYEAWSGRTVNREAIVEWMLMGGYPELRSRGLDAERFYGDYLATYLERDVRSILGVRSLRDFDRFMRLCAARTGQLSRTAPLRLTSASA